MKSVTSSSRNTPDCMQTEIDACLLNMQLEMNETEDDIEHDHVINNRDDTDGNEDNDDWMEGTIENHVAKQDFDDASEVQMHWDKNHDSTQLYQECMTPLNFHDVEIKSKQFLVSRRVINR